MNKIQKLLPYLILPILALLFSNCGNLTADQKAKWDKVMEIHDISMKNHGDMMQLGKELRKYKGDQSLPAALNYVISPTMTQIENADEAMMSWMKDLKGPVKVSGWDAEKIIQYWDDELAKIEKIDADIVSQKNAASELLKQIKGK